MNFERILARMVNEVEGALSATIMGFDGIPIASYVKESASVDVEAMAVEYTRIISEVVRVADAINAGGTREISITTKNYYIIFYVLPGNYFVALLMNDSASLGKGRYYLRKSAPDFVAEL